MEEPRDMVAAAVTGNTAYWFRGVTAALVEAGWELGLAKEEIILAVRWGIKRVRAMDLDNPDKYGENDLVAAGHGPLGELRRAAYVRIFQDWLFLVKSKSEVLRMWESYAKEFERMELVLGGLHDDK